MPANRSAVLLRHRQPYIDWVNSHNPSAEPPFDKYERPVYLLPEILSNQQGKAVLRRYSRVIFELELDGWTSNRAVWPTDRSYKTFCKCFEVEHDSMMFDLVAGDRALDEDEAIGE